MAEASPQDRRRYRKIFTRLWRNAAFCALPDGEKVLTLYVLSGPQTNRIGLFLFSIGEASEDLETPIPKLRTRLLRVCKAFGWEFDATARVIWIPSWWTFNDPKDNLKAFQGALTDLNDVPQTPLVQRFCLNLVGIPAALHGLMAPLREAAGIGIPDGIPDRIGDGMPDRSQEQEQEQEKEQEQESGGRSLLHLWNEVVTNLPKCEAFSPDRLRHAKARSGEQPDLRWWRQVFERMDVSDFLTGRKPSRDHPNWRADIDFALKPGNAGKVMEGKYDNRGPKRVAERSERWTCPHVERCGHQAMCDVKLEHPAKYPVKVPA